MGKQVTRVGGGGRGKRTEKDIMEKDEKVADPTNCHPRALFFIGSFFFLSKKDIKCSGQMFRANIHSREKQRTHLIINVIFPQGLWS